MKGWVKNNVRKKINREKLNYNRDKKDKKPLIKVKKKGLF